MARTDRVDSVDTQDDRGTDQSVAAVTICTVAIVLTVDLGRPILVRVKVVTAYIKSPPVNNLNNGGVP